MVIFGENCNQVNTKSAAVKLKYNSQHSTKNVSRVFIYKLKYGKGIKIFDPLVGVIDRAGFLYHVTLPNQTYIILVMTFSICQKTSSATTSATPKLG